MFGPPHRPTTAEHHQRINTRPISWSHRYQKNTDPTVEGWYRDSRPFVRRSASRRRRSRARLSEPSDFRRSAAQDQVAWVLPSYVGRGQSVADACKGPRIPQERREPTNPHYLPGAGEGSSDLATPFHPSGDGSPGAPDGGGRGNGPPVHRGPRHQPGAWRPAGARVLRLRPTSRPVRGRSGRSGRMVVSCCRAERRLRSLGRFTRQLDHMTLSTRTSLST